MIRHEPFITDSGGRTASVNGKHGREEFVLPRFTVWKWHAATQAPQVVEVGDDLEKLRAKHGIPAERVVFVSRPKP